MVSPVRARRRWHGKNAGFTARSYLLLGAIALANSGCLAWRSAAPRAGPPQVTPLYERGEWYRDYPANMNDAAAAVAPRSAN